MPLHSDTATRSLLYTQEKASTQQNRRRSGVSGCPSRHYFVYVPLVIICPFQKRLNISHGIYLYMHASLYVCMQRPYPLELELPGVMNCPRGVLGNKPSRAICALTGSQHIETTGQPRRVPVRPSIDSMIETRGLKPD